MASLLLLLFGHKMGYIEVLRYQAVSFVTSVQLVVNWPLELVRVIKEDLSNKKILVEENARLRQELLLAEASLQRLSFLEQDNAQLRKLLGVAKQAKWRMEAAQILRSIVDNYSQQITINKGKSSGLYIGQPVLDSHGLIGQVIKVDTKFSRVLLLTSKKSAIPVIISRNGLQTIAVGLDDEAYLELLNVPETVDIKNGDVLVTSDLGKHFPAGCLVGVVGEIKKVVGERFMKVYVIPKAHVSSDLHVLLMYPPKKHK